MFAVLDGARTVVQPGGNSSVAVWKLLFSRAAFSAVVAVYADAVVAVYADAVVVCTIVVAICADGGDGRVFCPCGWNFLAG